MRTEESKAAPEILMGTKKNLDNDTIRQIFRLRKHAFIDRRKWDIRSYKGGELECDVYDDHDARYIALKEGNKIVGCVRLRPSWLPNLLTGPLNNIAPEEERGKISDYYWEASRFVVSRVEKSNFWYSACQSNKRTLYLFSAIINYALKNYIPGYEVIIDRPMLTIIKRSGWPIKVISGARGSNGEEVYYAHLSCTSLAYWLVSKKLSLAETVLSEAV